MVDSERKWRKMALKVGGSGIKAASLWTGRQIHPPPQIYMASHITQAAVKHLIGGGFRLVYSLRGRTADTTEA